MRDAARHDGVREGNAAHRRAARRGLDSLLERLSPASEAIVMGTGIISIALALDGSRTLAHLTLMLAAAAWISLGLLLTVGVVRDSIRFRSRSRTPAALACVAGPSVLGTAVTLLGWTWAGAVLLVIAFALWVLMLGPVLGHLRTPTIGASFMLTVAPESLALLGAIIATADRARWLLIASLVPFALGLLLYLVVLRRFDFRVLLTGQGPHWVSGGALAISAVTASRIALGWTSLRLPAVRRERLRMWRWRCGCWPSRRCPSWSSRSCAHRGSTTRGVAGRPSSPSGCTPRAASRWARPRAPRPSPGLPECGYGSPSPCGCWWPAGLSGRRFVTGPGLSMRVRGTPGDTAPPNDRSPTRHAEEPRQDRRERRAR
jgi:Voltage-dependent anion channel